MDQKYDRLYPSAPLENIDLEQRLEKKVKDVNKLNRFYENIKGMITYFEDKNYKSKKKYKKYKTITTILKPIDSFVIIGATLTSVTLSVTGFGLAIVPISTGIACGISLCNKILHEIVMKKDKKGKKNYMRKIKKQLNLLIIYSENLYKIMGLIKMNTNLYVILLLKIWMKQKINLFHKYEHKNKIKIF